MKGCCTPEPLLPLTTGGVPSLGMLPPPAHQHHSQSAAGADTPSSMRLTTHRRQRHACNPRTVTDPQSNTSTASTTKPQSRLAADISNDFLGFLAQQSPCPGPAIKPRQSCNDEACRQIRQRTRQAEVAADGVQPGLAVLRVGDHVIFPRHRRAARLMRLPVRKRAALERGAARRVGGWSRGVAGRGPQLLHDRPPPLLPQREQHRSRCTTGDSSSHELSSVGLLHKTSLQDFVQKLTVYLPASALAPVAGAQEAHD